MPSRRAKSTKNPGNERIDLPCPSRYFRLTGIHGTVVVDILM
jgi:hypothetical protein